MVFLQLSNFDNMCLFIDLNIDFMQEMRTKPMFQSLCLTSHCKSLTDYYPASLEPSTGQGYGKTEY